MLKTLRFEEPDRPPHFEMWFQLTREAFGVEHPKYPGNTSADEKKRLLEQGMDVYEHIVRKFGWDALMVLEPPQDPDGIAAARRRFGRDLLVGGIVWEGVWSIDIVKDWDRFSADLFDHPGKVHEGAERLYRIAEDRVNRMVDAGADFLMFASDVGFNGGPFLSPTQFREFVTPYLARLCALTRQRGAIPMMHSDGMLMPVLDQIMEAGPAVLQSIDPMAGMDIAEVKRLTYGKMALMGNVRCDYLQHGTPEQIRESTEYCLKHGTPGGGYIFSSSNTVFRGVPLENYETMVSVYRESAGRSKP